MSGHQSLSYLKRIAVAACACAMLAGCGPARGGTTGAGPGRPRSATAPATGSGGPSTPGAAGTSPAQVTGNFCTDFAHLKDHIPAIPPGDKGNVQALRRDATRLLAAAAAYFTALAGEAPPAVASALRTIASGYQRDEGVAQSQGSAASLEHLIRTAQYAGPALSALRVVAHYYASHCI